MGRTLSRAAAPASPSRGQAGRAAPVLRSADMDALAAANQRLEAQRAALSARAELDREAALWRDASPEACLAAVFARCRDADHDLARLSPAQLERALAPDPLPADTLALLAARRESTP
jgi:hypothetical protein